MQVAEKRKGLLDEMAIEKQTAETNHKQQLEKLQEEHKVSLISASNRIINERVNCGAMYFTQGQRKTLTRMGIEQLRPQGLLGFTHGGFSSLEKPPC